MLKRNHRGRAIGPSPDDNGSVLYAITRYHVDSFSTPLPNKRILLNNFATSEFNSTRYVIHTYIRMRVSYVHPYVKRYKCICKSCCCCCFTCIYGMYHTNVYLTCRQRKTSHTKNYLQFRTCTSWFFIRICRNFVFSRYTTCQKIYKRNNILNFEQKQLN